MATKKNADSSESKSTKTELGNELFRVKVSAGDLDRKNAVVNVPIWYDGIQFMSVVLTDEKGNEITGQVGGGYANDFYKLSEKFAPDSGVQFKVPARLIFILPKLAAGKSVTLVATPAAMGMKSKYEWKEDDSKQAELRFDGKPVIKAMTRNVDESSPESRAETYKVYHHVYSPKGDRLLTKGAGGLFPHHRGIFFGFNKISYGHEQTADIWHCNNGESQVSQGSVNQVSPLYGRAVSIIAWNGQDGAPFAFEQRELVALKVDGATVIDFRTTLSSMVGPIKLAGDPQHAGVQFRASQEVPDHTKNLTYYIRPDGKAKPGQFRNWSGKKDETEENKLHVDLPWLAMSIALPLETTETVDEARTERFTVCYLDSPTNPKPARFSERDYGRFGSYFETTIDLEKPLYLHYRYWIIDGEMDVEQVQALSDQFTNPVKVELLK